VTDISRSRPRAGGTGGDAQRHARLHRAETLAEELSMLFREGEYTATFDLKRRGGHGEHPAVHGITHLNRRTHGDGDKEGSKRL